MPQPAPPTFPDACERVLRDPDGEHSLFTTLAPLYDRLRSESRLDEQFEAVRAFAPASGRALDLGCGVGGLTSRLVDRYDRVVAVDEHFQLLRYLPRYAPTADALVGDPTTPPVTGRFETVTTLGGLTSHLSPDAVGAFFETAAEHLAPGGTLLVGAVTDPAAFREDAVGLFRGSGYRLERAVTDLPAGDGVDLRADYRVTDEGDGRSATTRETLHVYSHETTALRGAAREAGLDDVRVLNAADGDEQAVVVVARAGE